MAHFLWKKRFKKRHFYSDRISRIPFNEESIEPYTINPSIMSLEADLLKMINIVVNQKKGCVDGQNGNMFDNYIKSWEDLAKSSLEKQKATHDDKIQTLSNVRKSIRKNAEDWLKSEKEELDVIAEKIQKLETVYSDFCSNKNL